MIRRFINSRLQANERVLRVVLFCACMQVFPCVAQTTCATSATNWMERVSSGFYAEHGYPPFSYFFNDLTDRRLKVEFVDKGVMRISNRLSARRARELGNEKADHLKFVDMYSVHFEDKLMAVVDGIVSTTRSGKTGQEVVAPFDYSREDVVLGDALFPLLAPGDRIYFERNYEKIRIGSFVFDVQGFTDDDLRLFNRFVKEEVFGEK